MAGGPLELVFAPIPFGWIKGISALQRTDAQLGCSHSTAAITLSRLQEEAKERVGSFCAHSEMNALLHPKAFSWLSLDHSLS